MSFESLAFSTLKVNSKAFVQRYFDWIVPVFLGILIVVLYSPSLTAYFISDDFSFLAFLHFYARDVLNGQKWTEWFIGGIQGYVFFRPLGNLIWLLNYAAFGLNPLGYHVISVLFHILSTYAVFFLAFILTQNRISATVSAMLFAAMPVHAGAVSWVAANYDEASGFFYFVSVVFFVVYLRKRMCRWYLAAFATFVAALCTKETALTLPVMILSYDVVFGRIRPFRLRELAKRHAPFWIIVGIRLISFGHGFTGIRLTGVDWWGWVDGILLRLANPLLAEVTVEMRATLLVLMMLLLWVYRSRQEVVYSLLWIPVTFVPTLMGEVTDRSFYIPTFGLSVVLASILTPPGIYSRKWLTMIAFTVLLWLMVIYGKTLVSMNQSIHHAGEVAEAIPRQIIALHPTVSPTERLVFVGVPDQVPEGPLVYLTGFLGSLQIVYTSQEIQVFKYGKFPIWSKLDNTYFFEVNHRRVAERTDLIQVLEERARCEDYSVPFLAWNFSDNAHDWEPWNHLTGFVIHDGALFTRAEANDPIIGGPPIDIPAIAIGAIEITMRVQAAQPNLQGEVYWLASGQADFSPYLKESFNVQADGDWHTYRIDIAKKDKLLLGDHILQLRLDPTNAPADIAIKSIQIYTHCLAVQDERCACVD